MSMYKIYGYCKKKLFYEKLCEYIIHQKYYLVIEKKQKNVIMESQKAIATEWLTM